ncbi:hypothetical protein BDW62DRAFT_128694 [Aspergillus aurantiobrunneus]
MSPLSYQGIQGPTVMGPDRPNTHGNAVSSGPFLQDIRQFNSHLEFPTATPELPATTMELNRARDFGTTTLDQQLWSNWAVSHPNNEVNSLIKSTDNDVFPHDHGLPTFDECSGNFGTGQDAFGNDMGANILNSYETSFGQNPTDFPSTVLGNTVYQQPLKHHGKFVSSASDPNGVSSGIYPDLSSVGISNTARGTENHSLNTSDVGLTPENPGNSISQTVDAHGFESDASNPSFGIPIPLYMNGDLQHNPANSHVDTVSNHDFKHSDTAHQSIEDSLESQLVGNSDGQERPGSTFSDRSDVSHNNESTVETFTPISQQLEDGLADRPAFYRDLILDALNNPDGDSGIETNFRSLEEAEEHFRVRGREPEHDPTIPQTLAQKRAIVKTLSNLVWSVDNSQDNQKQRDTFQKNATDMGKIELACWKVLEAVIKREKEGAYTKRKQHGTIGSFASRMAAVMESLDCHKTICNHLLRDHYIHVFIDDPIQARKRVLNNQRLNRHKAAVMQLGKGIRAGNIQQSRATSSNQIKEVTENQQEPVQPQGVKTKNSTKTRTRTRNQTQTQSKAQAPASRLSPGLAINMAKHSPENHPGVFPCRTQRQTPQPQNYQGGQYSVTGTPTQGNQALAHPAYRMEHQPMENGFNSSLMSEYHQIQKPQMAQLMNSGFVPGQNSTYRQLQNSRMNQSLGYHPGSMNILPYLQGSQWSMADDALMNMPENMCRQTPTAFNPPEASQQYVNSATALGKRSRQDSEVDDASGRTKRHG